jgi:tetratricopeptide (TPR) repeat protein
MLKDRYGSPLTTTSQRARDAYVEGVDRFLAAGDDVEGAFHEAIAADDGFAMARIGLARMHQVRGRGAEARASLEAARERLGGVSSREAAQVDILGDMIEGRAQQARSRVWQHVADHPTDILVAQSCTSVFGLIGFSGNAGREAEQLAYTTLLAPHYGDDWWFLCQHAFAQMEAGQTGPAAENIERSLALKPDSAHSAHVRAHLYYENGETDAGFGYIDQFCSDYPATAYLHCHISWHVALWALARGDVSRMWEIFDTGVAPDRTPAPPLNVMTDSAALLFRATAAGVVVSPDRWLQISDFADRVFPNPGLAFADVHAALAHAMAGQPERLQRVIDGAKGPAGSVVAALARSFQALAGDRPDAAIHELTQVMAGHERIGGSRAQRDILEIALASALLRAGHPDEARRSLQMRRPHTAQDHAVAGLAH